jgi:hypothetical protein
MAVTLNASTTTGLVQSADTSGSLNIQSNGTTVLGVTSTGASVTGTQSVSGDLSFNSGYGSSAVAYGCRAWVNFNGGTNTGGFCTIRGSGNVTSVADNGSGDYTINFTNAMPDANYVVVSVSADLSVSSLGGIGLRGTTSPSTTAVRVGATAGDGSNFDQSHMHFAIFR